MKIGGEVKQQKIKKSMTHKYYIKLLTVSLVFLSELLIAQNNKINLWSSEIPGAIAAKDYKEVYDINQGRVSKVKTPTLTAFIPEKPNGTAVVICPGGGYAILAINKEGYKVGEWLNTLGITAFVLKYRLPSDDIMENKSIGPLQDAQESIRFVRRNAQKWNINKDKIGVLGFSAGGHLAATLSTHYNDKVYHVSDTISARPNFSILIYPVISMTNEITHQGSRNRLLGKSPSVELIEKYSNEKQIDVLTPPAFIVHATDDKTVPIENSIAYYLALKNNNVPAELHMYQDGKHAFFLGRENTTSQYWRNQCKNWLFLNNYIN
jgi:acetyl esterase/lipase